VFRQVIRDSAVYGLAQILVRGLSIFLLPIFTRVLSPREYGVLDILTVFASFAGVAVALEVTQGMARSLADADTEKAKTRYASTALWFAVGAYTLFGIAALVWSPRLSAMLFGSPQYTGVVRIAVIAICGNGIFSVVQNQLRWNLQASRYSLTSVVYSAISLSCALILVVALRWGASGVLTGQIVGAVAGIALAVGFARSRFRRVFDRRKLREMLRFSVPLVPSSVGVFVTLYIDRVAIKQLMTLADVGVFGVAYRLASVVSLLLIGLQSALTPLIFTRYRESATPGHLARIFRSFSAVALLVCLTLALFSREILAIFAAPAYADGASVVPLLAPAILLLAMYIFAPGLDIARRTGIVATVNIFAAALNVALNFALVPRFGIRGAAMATLFSAAMLFATYMTLSQRFYFVPHRWGQLALATAAVIGLGIVGTQVEAGLWLNLVIRIGLVAVAALLLVTLGLVEWTELRRSWQSLWAFRLGSRA
jgi:O-antigen/teichoic acid export membrane protein